MWIVSLKPIWVRNDAITLYWEDVERSQSEKGECYMNEKSTTCMRETGPTVSYDWEIWNIWKQMISMHRLRALKYTQRKLWRVY